MKITLVNDESEVLEIWDTNDDSWCYNPTTEQLVLDVVGNIRDILHKESEKHEAEVRAEFGE